MTDQASTPTLDPERRIEAIGAPTDLTHPANLEAHAPTASPTLSDDQLRGIGRFLAFGWFGTVVLRFMLLTGSSSAGWELATWAVPGLYLVAVHAYAIRTGQRRILRGFWPPVLVGLGILLMAPVVIFFFALAGMA